jgi:ribosome-binding factor A
LQDPRLIGVSITEVKVDRELAFASIYVSALEGSSRSKEVLQGFESASSYIRKLLSMRIELRSFPRLRFYWDPTPERADRIEQILATIKKEEENKPDQTIEEENTDDTTNE